MVQHNIISDIGGVGIIIEAKYECGQFPQRTYSPQSEEFDRYVPRLGQIGVGVGQTS